MPLLCLALADSRSSGDLYAILGNAIRSARLERKVTQDQLGKAVGLTRTSVVNIEKGRQKVPLDTLYNIARALGTNVHDLLPAAPDQRPRQQPALPADLSPAEQDWIRSVAQGRTGGPT